MEAYRNAAMTSAKSAWQHWQSGLPAKSLVMTREDASGLLDVITKEAHGDLRLVSRIHFEGCLPSGLFPAMERVLGTLARQEGAPKLLQQSLCDLQDLAEVYGVGLKDLPLDETCPRGLVESGGLAYDMAHLFEEVGGACACARLVWVLCLSGLDTLPKHELAALLGGLKRAHQNNVPVLVLAEGSDALRHTMGEAQPYSERLFEFV